MLPSVLRQAGPPQIFRFLAPSPPPSINHPKPCSSSELDTSVMRKCIHQRSFSSPWTWRWRALRTSSRSGPQAIKQMSNPELLSLVWEGTENATISTPNDEDCENGGPDLEGALQSSSRFTRYSTRRCSPLTESHLVAARTRHREEKPPPNKGRSPFQLKLQRNPYGSLSSIKRRLRC